MTEQSGPITQSVSNEGQPVISPREKRFRDYYADYTTRKGYRFEASDRNRLGIPIVPDGWLPFSSGMPRSKLQRFSPHLEPSQGGYMEVNYAEKDSDRKPFWTAVGLFDHAGEYNSAIFFGGVPEGVEILLIAPQKYFIKDGENNSAISGEGVNIHHGRFILVGREHVTILSSSGQTIQFERYCVVPEGYEGEYRAVLGIEDGKLIEHDRTIVSKPGEVVDTDESFDMPGPQEKMLYINQREPLGGGGSQVITKKIYFIQPNLTKLAKDNAGGK